MTQADAAHTVLVAAIAVVATLLVSRCYVSHSIHRPRDPGLEDQALDTMLAARTADSLQCFVVREPADLAGRYCIRWSPLKMPCSGFVPCSEGRNAIHRTTDLD